MGGGTPHCSFNGKLEKEKRKIVFDHAQKSKEANERREGPGMCRSVERRILEKKKADLCVPFNGTKRSVLFSRGTG